LLKTTGKYTQFGAALIRAGKIGGSGQTALFPVIAGLTRNLLEMCATGRIADQVRNDDSFVSARNRPQPKIS